MNKQELIEAIGELPNELGWISIGSRVVSLKDRLLELVNQLDEPKKVTVPKFVAEWIVLAREKCLTLRQALDHYSLKGEIQKWLQFRDNQDLFARAWLDGYEVEWEKVYTVKIPNPHHDGITVLEKVGDDVIMSQMDDYLAKWQEEPEYQLTESEIRKDFEWAWQAGFAKEVE